MNLGELFVKLKIAADPKNAEQVSKFRTGIISLKDKANEFKKQSDNLISTKFSGFINENEIASNGLVQSFEQLNENAQKIKTTVSGLITSIGKMRIASDDLSSNLYGLTESTGQTEISLFDLERQVNISSENISKSLAGVGQKNKLVERFESFGKAANDFRKQANEIIKTKFSRFFQESEFASLGLLGKLTDIVGKANMVRLAILGVVAAMVKLTQNAAEASEHLFKFSLNTGLSTTNLQKWQHQAEQVGVSADEVANSFAALQQKAMDIQLGQGDARAFQLSGVSWFADAETQLGQIEKMLATRPAALGTKLAMDMGLSEDMITFLRMRSQLKPADEGLILSPDEIRDLKDFSIDFKATLAAFQNAMRKIGALILPVTRPLMNLSNRLMKVGVEISKWVAESKKFQMVLVGLGIAAGLLAIKLFPVTAVVLAISAAIGAALLIIDDVATFIRGGDSVTGLLWDGLKNGFKTVISEIKKDWTVLIDWFVQGIGKLVDIIVSPILKVLELIGVLQNVDYKGAEKALSSGWKSVKEIDGSTFTGLWDKLGDFFSPIAPAISGGPMLPAGASSLNQNVQINVNGAKEPAAVAKEIQSHLRKQTSDAVYQMPRQEQ